MEQRLSTTQAPPDYIDEAAETQCIDPVPVIVITSFTCFMIYLLLVLCVSMFAEEVTKQSDNNHHHHQRHHQQHLLHTQQSRK